MKRFIGGCVAASMIGVAVLPGCATMEGSAGTGAALGGLAGGIIGHQSGRAIEGAFVGALAGAIAGAVVHDVRDRRMRTAQETHQTYQFQPDQGLQLHIEESIIEPRQVPAGSRMNGTVNYAVMGTGTGVPVREQFVVMRGNEPVSTVYDGTPTRSDGTFSKTVVIELPEDVAPGTYRLANTVSTQSVSRTAYTDFEVVERTASTDAREVRVAATP